MSTIEHIAAREILDSRGKPTVEVTLVLKSGWSTRHTTTATASVPAGASTGACEAKELRDGEARYGGKGVRKAVAAIEGEIVQAVRGRSFTQEELDRKLITLDGTPDKSRLGANAILGVSLAFARAYACAYGIPLYRHVAALAGTTPALPTPMINVINGGLHAHGTVAIQEFLLIPRDKKRALGRALEDAAQVIDALRTPFIEEHGTSAVGDEGGFAAPLHNDETALRYIMQALAAADMRDTFDIGLDAAASSMYRSTAPGEAPAYQLVEGPLNTAGLLDWYGKLSEQYPIVSIEDPLREDDWDGFVEFKRRFGAVQSVGDDLLVTNASRIHEAVARQAADAVVIKPNQVGTLTETIEAAHAARTGGLKLVASHRSGETNDDWIADVAVGLGADFLKAGSLARGERVAKYNRLLAIEPHI